MFFINIPHDIVRSSYSLQNMHFPICDMEQACTNKENIGLLLAKWNVGDVNVLIN